jgi:tRNA(adenine34) deaminase
LFWSLAGSALVSEFYFLTFTFLLFPFTFVFFLTSTVCRTAIFMVIYVPDAPVAQWIELLTTDQKVGGSTPSRCVSLSRPKAMKKDSAYFMKKALLLAAKAEKRGEVPVGAVLVREGRVIGRGGNAPIGNCDPSAHAEIVALRRAGKKIGEYRLNGAEMYVTLEPCLMCYSAMVQARIAKLHYGADDPKNGIFSSGVFENVKNIYNHRIEVEAGLLSGPASAMLSGFFKARRGAGAVERDGLENRCGG